MVTILIPAPIVVAGENLPEIIQNDDFKNRRLALLDSLVDGVAIIYSSGYSGDAGYRSDSRFWYLTGLDDEGAILVLAPEGVDREILLLPPRDIEAERWTGERPALSESLKATLGFDQIKRTGALDGIIFNQMKKTPKLHLISKLARPSQDVPDDYQYYKKVSERIPGVSIENSTRFLENMRMIKSDSEIKAIEKAIEVTHNGISDLLRALKPGILEFQLDGILEESFKKQGAQHMAFSPIIGGGAETTILHYEKRNNPIKSGQLLLIDVGAKWEHYSADISRTLPVDGKFTEEQKNIYNIVLKAHIAAISAIKPGVTIREIDDVARDVIRKAGYADDFIHSTSHHLGLDTHDAANYWTPLKPGMVITVEPGIYLPESEIGIRIEDDVLVTEKGNRVLSDQIPREIDDVEKWVSEERNAK
jgi:Xaa-Pro aminopeptidase